MILRLENMTDNFSKYLRKIHTEFSEHICNWNLSSCQRINFDLVVSKNKYFKYFFL